MTTTHPDPAGPLRPPISIRLCGPGDLPLVAPLFDAYRQFYGEPADLQRAEEFLRDRQARAESLLLLAGGAASPPLGFAQLYPSFSSVACRPILVLNDLFVAPAARGQGIARALLEAAADLGRRRRAARLVLETAEANRAAQALYEDFGFVRAQGFFTYTLALD